MKAANPLIIVPMSAGLQLPLKQAAESDNHIPLWPTDVLVKGGEIIGCLSLAAMPIAHCWMHTKKASAFDSLKMIQAVDEKMRDRNVYSFVAVCSDNSPYYDVLPRFGYDNAGKGAFFLKNVS